MKKAAILFFLAALLVSCTTAEKKQDNEGEMLTVYASFYPIYDFAQKIGGDKIKLVNMLPEGQETHDWEPTPADIAGLLDADIFIYSGAGMEHWVEKTLHTIKNENLAVLEAAQGLELIDRSEDSGAHNQDPHVWLSIKNAKKQMENIKNMLVKADEKNSAYYEANYERYAKEFDALDDEFRDVLSSAENKMIVVSHEAFGYLCNDYGLEQIGIQELIPDSEPNPARMAEIIELVKENNIQVIFFEQSASSKISEIIAEQTGATTDMLSTLEGLSSEQRLAGDDYLSVMRRNLEAIAKALK